MTIFTAINLVIATAFFGWHLTELGNMIVARLGGKNPAAGRVVSNIIYAVLGLLWLVSACLFYDVVRG